MTLVRVTRRRVQSDELRSHLYAGTAGGHVRTRRTRDTYECHTPLVYDPIGSRLMMT